ncbi:MAG: NUDIX domain-containing protein [Lentisphaerae bacterium]|nr:NUDIX domain-containing protein [Lentisphaerota bacterium]
MPVVCLVMVDKRGCLFAVQRSAHKRLALLWEFPGGKVEFREVQEKALRREIKEELSLCVGKLEQILDSLHQYDFGTICLTPFFINSLNVRILSLLSKTVFAGATP